MVAVLLDNFTLATRKEKDKIKMEALERSDRTSGSCKRSLSLDPLICRLIAGERRRVHGAPASGKAGQGRSLWCGVRREGGDAR